MDEANQVRREEKDGDWAGWGEMKRQDLEGDS